MIYVTAHRVVAPDGHLSGINAFCHRSAGVPTPLTTGAMLRIAENEPGALVDERCDLPPGGNLVRSYLDIVAADDAAAEAVATALDAMRCHVVAGATLPLISIVAGVGVRFGADFGLYGEVAAEFDALVERARVLMRRTDGTDG